MRGNMHQCQVLHQLAVTGHAWAEVAVLIGGQDFRIYRIERDEEKIRDLTERETQFWLQVTRNQQPEPDGSEDAGSALAWLFPRDDGETVDLSDSPEFNQLFGELLHLREHKEEVELRESQIKQRLQATLGEATAGLFADGKITWKRSKDRLAPIWTGSVRIIPTYSATTSNRCPAHAVSLFRLLILAGVKQHDQGTSDYPARDRADLYRQAGTERREMGAGEG